MKLRIDFTIEGQEALATGAVVYPWHFSCKNTEDPVWGNPVKGNVPLGELEVTLPGPEAGIASILDSIAARERELRQQLNEDLRALEERRSKLLAITMSPAPAPLADKFPHNFLSHGIPVTADLSENWRDMTTCLKTGCEMRYNNTHWFWGDLHRDYRGKYYFNATDAAGQDLSAIPEDADCCAITIKPEHNPQRCGKVFILDDVIFNDAFIKFNDEWNQS